MIRDLDLLDRDGDRGELLLLIVDALCDLMSLESDELWQELVSFRFCEGYDLLPLTKVCRSVA